GDGEASEKLTPYKGILAETKRHVAQTCQKLCPKWGPHPLHVLRWPWQLQFPHPLTPLKTKSKETPSSPPLHRFPPFGFFSTHEKRELGFLFPKLLPAHHIQHNHKA
ncbi:hypothetical protein QQP08_027701, partial [Theobroma cacao]